MKAACSRCLAFNKKEWEKKEAYTKAYDEAQSKHLKATGGDYKAWYQSEEYDALTEHPDEFVICNNTRGGCSPAPDRACQAFFPPDPRCGSCFWFVSIEADSSTGRCWLEPQAMTIGTERFCSHFKANGVDEKEAE